MKKFIITEEEKNRIRGLYEQTSPSDVYSAILGYLAEHGDSMSKDSTIDSLNMLGSQKEVRHFCEAKRDNKTANVLSKPAQVLFDTISKMVKESSNISGYIEIGKTVKSNDFT